MSDFVSNLFGGGGSTGTDATGGGNPFADALSGIGTALSGMGSSPANAMPVGNDASSPPIDPSLAAAASITPPASLSPQGDSTGIGGTLSGGQPDQPQKNQQPQQAQQDQEFAPVNAVAQLRNALKQIAGQQRNPYQQPPQPAPLQAAARINTDPTFPLPNLAPGQTGPQSPPPTALPQLLGAPMGQGGIGSDAAATASNFPTTAGQSAAEGGPASANPITDPAEARIPPGAASAPSTVGGAPLPPTDDQGRQITVKKPGEGAAPPQTPEEEPGADQPQPDLPTRTPVPTRKGPPGQRVPPQIMQGGPTGLNQLAQLALGLMPLIAAAASGGFGGGRRGGFRGFRHPGRGHWPYYHPGMGWRFHDFHPGRPWMPMNPTHMRLFGVRGQQGGQPDASQILQAIFGNTGMGQANQQRAGGGYPQGMWQGGPEGGGGQGYVRSGNRFTDALTTLESPQGNVVSRSDRDSQGRTLREGGDQSEIAQGFFQIQNHRNGGTWSHFAAQAGVSAASPMQASYEEQHRVARLIPIGQWGGRTKERLHQQFGSFPERWTLGQLEDYFGRGVQQQAAAQ